MAVTEKLIETVIKYPILYDLYHEDYRNIKKKDKIWDQIGSELKENGEEMKKRWKNLKDTYVKYLKNNRTKSRPATKKIKNWRWADQMEPFRPFVAFIKTSFSVSDICSEEDVSESQTPPIDVEDIKKEDCQFQLSEKNPTGDITERELQENTSHILSVTDLTSTQIAKATRKRIIDSINDSNLTSSVNALNNYFQNKKKSEMDATELLFMAHARTVKTFSGKRQAIAKMKIAQVIMEQEILHHEELSSNPEHDQNSVY